MSLLIKRNHNVIDILLSFALNLGIIIGLVGILAKAKLVNIQAKWAGVSLFLFCAYFVALIMGGSVIQVERLFPDINYNWGGKIASILLWIVTLFIFTGLNKTYKAADMGFTLKQNQGSLRPALLAVLLAITFQIVITLALGGADGVDTETLLYQATMPGFDEEPMFRGIILLTLSLGIVSNRFNVFGAQLNIAGLVFALLFASVHGVSFSNGEVHFAAVAFFFSGIVGLILLWLRERTGSLLLPIIAHNLVNVTGQII